MSMHPAGRFDAHITDHGYNTAKTTGTLQLCVTFATEHGSITGYFALTDKTAERLVKTIRNMGYQGDDLDVLNDGQAMLGNWCTITIEHEEYNGQLNAKVRYVDPYGAAPQSARLDPAKLAAANAKRFNALLKHEAKTTPAKQPPSTLPPAASEPPATGYDERNPPPPDEPGF